LARGLYSLQ